MKPKRVHALRKDRRGGIEGLPLQLLILVVIAGVCLTVMLGWMGNIETPKSITSVTADDGELDVTETNGVYYSDGKVTITVLDQDKNPLEGATVVLSGLNVKTIDGETAHGTTDSDGKVTFSNLKMDLRGNVGFVNVDVSKSGYGENNSCKITVVN